jgi:hypothetical protein
MESGKCRKIISNLSNKTYNINYWIDFPRHDELRISIEKLILYKEILYKRDFMGYLDKSVSLTNLDIKKDSLL